jgi:hypothetical protein
LDIEVSFLRIDLLQANRTVQKAMFLLFEAFKNAFVSILI